MGNPLDSFPNIDPTELGLNDRLTFGKYQGKKIIKVMDSDPQYLAWALKNVSFFDMTVKAKDRLVEKLAEVLKYDIYGDLSEDDFRDYGNGPSWMDDIDIPY